MEEQELIRQAGQGDESAFEALVKAYEKPVYNLCLRMCGDRDEAFDLSQDTMAFAHCLQHLHRSYAEEKTQKNRVSDGAGR